MPYAVRKSGKGYQVVNKHTNKKYSKKPLPKARAKAQLRAIYANTHGESFEQKLDKVLTEFKFN